MRSMIHLLLVPICALLAQGAIAQARVYKDHAEIKRTGQNVTARADDPRPLLQAMVGLAEEYGWNVDFEDPPYQSDYDLQDVTDAKWRLENPTARGAKLPKGRPFAFAFVETVATPTSRDERSALLKRMIAEYNASGNPGKFALRQDAGRTSIVGTGVRNPGGTEIAIQPVLDRPISIAEQTTDGLSAVREILALVSSASGVKIQDAIQPTSALRQAQVTIGGNQISARVLLARVLSQTNRKLQWQLLFDPDSATYVFNLLVTTRVQQNAAGDRVPLLVR